MASWIEATGYLASLLVFTTFYMKTMIRLRIAAIASNMLFILYGFFADLPPILLLHLTLLPMNLWRAVEMVRMIDRVEKAAVGDVSAEWLQPFMHAMRYEKGRILFFRGDPADDIFFVVRGAVRFEEIGERAGPGAFFGEIGVFSSERRRTMTARCDEDTELLRIGERELAELCHQNPAISFHLLKLITNRLLSNVERAEAAKRA